MEQTRDFNYVKDIAAANAYFATQSPATGVFNVAYGGKISNKGLCSTICKLTGSQSEIVHAAERAGDVKHSLASVDKIRATGFSPAGSLNEGLRATVEFLKCQTQGR